MKGMKKLFALLAVLTMALTLTPMVTPVSAQAWPSTLTITAVEFGTEADFLYDVDGGGLDNTASVIKISGTAEISDPAALDAAQFKLYDRRPGQVPVTNATVAVNKATGAFDIYALWSALVSANVIDDGLFTVAYDTAPTATTIIRFFNVETDAPDTVPSGTTITITGTVTSKGEPVSDWTVYSAMLWRKGASTASGTQALDVNGEFTFSNFQFSATPGTEFYITVQKASNTAYNEAPYKTIEVDKADIGLSVTPTSLVVGDTATTVTLTFESGGSAISGANVDAVVTLNGSPLYFGSGVTNSSGEYAITFIPSAEGTATITANVSGPDYYGTGYTATIAIKPVPTPKLNVSISGSTNLIVGATALYTATVVPTGMPSNFNSASVVYSWSSSNPDVAKITSNTTSSSVVLQALGVGQTVLSVTASSAPYSETATMLVTVSPLAATLSIGNASGQWENVNGQWIYQVSYDVYNAPANAQSATVSLKYGDQVLGQAALNFRQVSTSFDAAYGVLGGSDNVLTIQVEGYTASTVVPISFFKVSSTFKDSYVSGQPVGEVTGTITTVSGGVIANTSTIGLGLVAVWKDADGKSYAGKIAPITATLSSDKKTATFSVANGAFRFIAPAGNVYLVSDEIYNKVNAPSTSIGGVSVSKFGYATITLTQGKLVANPDTVNAPAQNKEIYLYDQFGYPLKNTQVKVEYGYKDADGKAIPAVIAQTDAEGKVKLNFLQPYAYGTYTATIYTVKTTSPYVDGVVGINVSYAGGFALGDIDYADNATAIVPVTIGLGSTGASIKKLWITVEDPNEVLYPYYYYEYAANGDEVDMALKPASGFELTFEYANADACGIKVSDFYWETATPVKTVNLAGLAVQGGSFKVTARAELNDGTFVTDTATYIVKNYRVDSITPASTTYGTATTVKIVVKDWYGSYADDRNVKLVGPDGTEYTFIKGDFGTYTYTIPASAKPGTYRVKIDDKDYTGDGEGAYFVVKAVADLKVTAPATVNAMSKFDVAVTDKDGNPINGTWRILDPYYELYKVADGSVVSGRLTVDTANFASALSKVLPLGEYTLVIKSADNAHSAKVTFNVIAPATITPTVVTNGLKSSFVVQMTATGMSASMLKLRETSRAVLQVVNDKFNPESVTTISVPYYNLDVSGQTATITVTAHKLRACSNAVVRLLYGNFIIPTTVAVEHPQLSFVNTATLYAGDVVPVQVKLVDALGNPIKGAVIELSELGYFEKTATTNAEGIADFGNVTLSVAGNMVAELVYGPDQQKVIDYRLVGQTDNTNYKISTQILPARPAQDLKVTVTPTIVDAGKDALLTLTLVGADAKPVETGKAVMVTIGPTTYNGLVGANGVVTLTVKSESLTGTVVTGVVKVEGYNAATFTLAVNPKPAAGTVIELAPGMDVYTVNGETKFWDATPYIKNGRTLVPIRHLAEAVGFKASWDFSDPANKMVFIFKADQDPEKDKEHPFILLIIGQPTAMVNGNLVALDVAPEILNGRTMVPLRFVVETLGYKVEWLGNTIRLMK